MIKFLCAAIVGLIAVGCNPFGPEKSNEPSANADYTVDENGTGIKITRNASGGILSKVNYVDSLRQGISTSYYEDGTIQLEIEYNKGRKDGFEKYYYESGKLYRVTRYKNAIIDSIRVFYHKNGKLMAEVPYSDGDLCIGTKEYNDQGKQISFPDIIVKTRDEMAITGRVYYEFTLSRKLRKIEFSRIMDDNDLPCPRYFDPIDTEGGKIQFFLDVPPGKFIMGEEIVAAKGESYQRIPHLAIHRFAVSLTNPG